MGVERLEDVKKEVRSVLISSKEGMTLQEFLKAYRSLLGIRFPSRQLGFTTDNELIESMPDVVHMKTDRNGSFVLTAIADETTEHIQKLVRKQRSNKKKPNNNQKYIMNNSGQSCVSSSNSTQRNRPFVPAKLRGEILQILKKHPDGIGYTTFILDYSKTFSKSINLEWLSSNPSERFRKLVLAVPELEVKTVGNTEKLFISKHTLSDIPEDLDVVKKASPLQSNLLLSICDRSQERAAISKSSKENFEKVLKHFPEGIMAVHFPVLYQKLTGQQFDLHEFGYNSLLEMADALSEIFVRIPTPKSSNDWILFHVDYAPDVDFQSSLVYKSGSEVRLKNRISCTLREHVPSDIALPALQYISPEIPEEAKTLYVPVYVSSIISPSRFWFQLQTREAKLGLYSLEKEMDCFYNNLPNLGYKMADADIVVGATCAAFYAVDHHWYRGVIAALPSLDSVVVEFVDYGNSEQVPRSALYYLKYTFIHLPAQAYKAQLAAIKPANEKDKWTKETNKRFIDLCHRVCLMVQIKAVRNSTLSVLLCDTSGDDDVHINDTLVKEGYADFHRNKDIYNTPPLLYLNTSESSSSASTPLPSPLLNVAQISRHTENGTRDYCRKRLFTDESAVKQQKTKHVKRITSSDDYIMHILLVENKAYVSVGELSYLFWNDNCPDLLLIRLKYKNVTIPTITISRDHFPDLFEQCERFSVKDFDETKDSVTLFPLQYAPKIINMLGHPSENVRNILIREIDHFNPNNAEWKEPFEEPEPYKEFITSGNKFDRLCLHDLKARQEALRYKKKTLSDALQEKWSDNLIDQMRILDAIENYITNRIKEVEAICIEFSKCV
ncbi:Tudor domain-containing protein 5 [Araneus ventricosus]|uniref:Tudor domain-containing protein 5 n=1 Tax=Araneus ventricosus TaxID=182803 RepID=A0A4Y2BBT4_ARAVE|nr:Tudor domain-containing protein 5 [Araneus ventricosus]